MASRHPICRPVCLSLPQVAFPRISNSLREDHPVGSHLPGKVRLVVWEINKGLRLVLVWVAHLAWEIIDVS